MFNHTKLTKNPIRFESLIGLTPQRFNSVAKAIKKNFVKIEEKRLLKNKKQRSIGTGHPFRLHKRSNFDVHDVL